MLSSVRDSLLHLSSSQKWQRMLRDSVHLDAALVLLAAGPMTVNSRSICLARRFAFSTLHRGDSLVPSSLLFRLCSELCRCPTRLGSFSVLVRLCLGFISDSAFCASACGSISVHLRLGTLRICLRLHFGSVPVRLRFGFISDSAICASACCSISVRLRLGTLRVCLRFHFGSLVCPDGHA